MRTQEEILARIEEIKDRDMLGFEQGDLFECLDYKHIKPFLKEGVTEADWKPSPCDRESVLARMLDYMPFAWDKANNCRGISASRSMSHYTSWIWLLGDDAVSLFPNLLDYEYYGKDNLVAICEHFGWDASKWDDGVRTNGDY